jgi:hypothetical protein
MPRPRPVRPGSPPADRGGHERWLEGGGRSAPMKCSNDWRPAWGATVSNQRRAAPTMYGDHVSTSRADAVIPSRRNLAARTYASSTVRAGRLSCITLICSGAIARARVFRTDCGRAGAGVHPRSGSVPFRFHAASSASASASTSSASIASPQSPQRKFASGFAQALSSHAGHVYFVLLAAFFRAFTGSPARS